MNYSDLIGVIGVGLILLAYFCSSFKLMPSNSSLYFLLNTVGAALACYASYLISYWPFVILEATWTIVSLIALLRTRTL
ncbi:MAG: CBU_0592 family membrane protein [Candidatus Dadabacteria bacterium]